MTDEFAAIREALSFLHGDTAAEELCLSLKARFITTTALYEAPSGVLERAGLSERDALLLHEIPALARRIERDRFGVRPTMRSPEAAAAFLTPLYKGLTVEHFYLACLDASGRLIDCRLLERGSEDSAPFYLKEALTVIVESGAHAVLISHNHPSFSARPSRSDAICTLSLMRALHPIGCILLDHIIVCGESFSSLRADGYIRQDLFIQQNPTDDINAMWGHHTEEK